MLMRFAFMLTCGIACLSSTLASAQTTCPQREREVEASTKSPADAIRELAANDCLGNDADKTPISSQVWKALDLGSSIDKPKLFNMISSSLQKEVDQYGKELNGSGLSPEMQTVATAASDILGRIRSRLEASASNTQTPKYGAEHWKFLPLGLSFPKHSSEPKAISFKTQLLEASCPADAVMNKLTEHCRQAYGAALTGIRYATLGRAILFTADTIPDIVRAEEQAKLLMATWDSHFEEARHQYPWELVINSMRFRNEVKRQQEDGKPRGLISAPTSQIIFLHPSVGMEYISKVDKGDRLQPALLVELAGYNMWSYTAKGKTENAIGASVIASYTDRAKLSSTRYGVMIHWNHNISLGVTRGSGSTGIFLSADAAKLLGSISDSARKAFGDPTKK